MSTPPQSTNSPAPTSAQDTSGRDIIGEVDDLFANREYEAFCHQAMSVLVELSGGRAAVVYQADAAGNMNLRAEFNRQGHQLDPSLRPELVRLAGYSRETATSQKVTLSVGEHKLAALAVPFMGAEGPTVLILLLGPERAPFLEPTYTLVSLYGAVMANYSSRVQFRKTQNAFDHATLLVDLYTKAASASDYESAVAIVTSELQEIVGCAHLALGMERGGRMRLDSISGRKKREKRTQGFSRILNLMREVTAAENDVVWPPPDELGLKALVASNQDELLKIFSVAHVVAVPLVHSEHDNEGAMVAMFRQDDGLTPEKFELTSAMAPHIAALMILLGEALPTGLRGKIRKFARDTSFGKKVATLIAPIAIIGAMFLPVPHHIRAAARLTPDISRQVAAPVGGILEEVLVKPGDVVEKGQLLAKLDEKEIRSQLGQAVAKRDVAGKRRDQALAKGREFVAERQLAEHEYKALSLDVELMRDKLDHLEIRSPITGLILTGDLERSKGVPVETGQKLFEVASFDKFVVEISVNDEDINWVETGQEVALRLESRGGKVFGSKIEQVYPVSEVSDGENVFVCLGYVVDKDGRNFLRPGMRGRARVGAGWKPLGWIVFHKPWNYIKVRFF